MVDISCLDKSNIEMFIFRAIEGVIFLDVASKIHGQTFLPYEILKS